MSDTDTIEELDAPDTQALATPPHPRAVMRVLKGAMRKFVSGGGSNAIDLTVTAVPASQARTAPLTISGVVKVTPEVTMPPSVTVQLFASAVPQPPLQTATVNPVTGAYTTTFAGSTFGAGAYSAKVTCVIPAAVTSSNIFNLT